MKKILMYSAMLALATSCTNELEDLSVQEKGSNGLTFKADIENVDSRAELTYDAAEKKWNMFWYAEDDMIDIYGKNVLVGSNSVGNTWDPSNMLTYKASRTLGEGYFVSVYKNQLEIYADAL